MKRLIPILMLIPLGCSSCGFRHDLKEAIRHYDDNRVAMIEIVSDTLAVIADNPLITEGKYERLYIDGAIAVCMSPDCEVSTVQADKKDLNRVSLLIEGNKLKIGYKGRRTGSCRPITVNLPTNYNLANVSVDGASRFLGTALNATSFRADGASRIEASLGSDMYRVEVDCDEASKVTLSGGECVVCEVECDGASSVDLSGLNIQRAYVDLDGASSATVRASVSVNGNIEGASTLRYIGSPEMLAHSDYSSRIEQIEN